MNIQFHSARFSMTLTLAFCFFASLSNAQIRQTKLYIDDGFGHFSILTAASGGGALTLPSTTGTLLVSSNGGSGVTLQPTTPGTADIGNFNITGTGIFGGNVNLASGSSYQINGSTVLQNIGPYNIFVGANAGSSYQSGGSGDCVGIGAYALYSATTAWANTAVGANALESDVSAQGNTAMGWYALPLSTSGFDNTALGVWSMPRSISGNQNTAVGANALYYNVGGSLNTAIGDYAGKHNTTESDNTYVGASTDLIPGITNATAIGYQAVVTASNTIQLGDSSVTLVNTWGNITATGGTATLGIDTGVAGVKGLLVLEDGVSSSSFHATLQPSTSMASSQTFILPAIGGTLATAGGVILNGTSPQTGNFNITGMGTLGSGLSTGGTITASYAPNDGEPGVLSITNTSSATTNIAATLYNTGNGTNAVALKLDNSGSFATNQYDISGTGTAPGNWYVTSAGAGSFASIQLNGASAVTNAALSLKGTGSSGGHIQSQQTTAPTAAVGSSNNTDGAPAGGATVAHATDVAGTLTITENTGGTVPFAGPQAVVTFNKAYVTPPIVIITPVNTTAVHDVANLYYYVNQSLTTVNGFTVSAGATPVQGDVLQFNYLIIETK